MKRYVIVPKSVFEADYEMVNRSTSTGLDSVRRDESGINVVLAFSSVEIPTCFIPYKIYTPSEILVELSNPEWSYEPTFLARLFRTKRYREWKALV